MQDAARSLTRCAALVCIIIMIACGGARQAVPQGTVPNGTSGDAAVAPTGAVTSLTGGPTPQSAETLSIEEYLRGRVPGLQVIPTEGGRFTLRLRGANLSLVGGQEVEPLVVIDGMPVAAAQLMKVLGALNPRDIRRVDVLRDVASTSMYGMRGSSGVILIRTTDW